MQEYREKSYIIEEDYSSKDDFALKCGPGMHTRPEGHSHSHHHHHLPEHGGYNNHKHGHEGHHSDGRKHNTWDSINEYSNHGGRHHHDGYKYPGSTTYGGLMNGSGARCEETCVQSTKYYGDGREIRPYYSAFKGIEE